MSAADKFLDQFISESLNNLHTSMTCGVIKYYPDEAPPKADLTPLLFHRAGESSQGRPTIRKAPVLRHVGTLEVGDTVFVSFAERALDFTGNRRHDLTDAVVVGVM